MAVGHVEFYFEHSLRGVHDFELYGVTAVGVFVVVAEILLLAPKAHAVFFYILRNLGAELGGDTGVQVR